MPSVGDLNGMYWLKGNAYDTISLKAYSLCGKPTAGLLPCEDNEN